MAEHVWPALSLSWRTALGTVTGFLGAALGSAGGVGGGSIFVPTANLIIGFDTKSATALSKCMIMGAALSTVVYNLRSKHPDEPDSPLIDYDIAMVLQPMLLLGISIGVIFNTVLPTWILTLILISVMISTGIRTLKKALFLWKKENEEKEKQLMQITIEEEESNDSYQPLTENTDHRSTFFVCDGLRLNVKWKNVAVLLVVWIMFLVLQILLERSKTCSTMYWVLNALQVPVSGLAFTFAAVNLYQKTNREYASCEEYGRMPVSFRLLAMCALGSLIAGMIGGLLGLGGGFALGPLLLEFGAHPQVLSATATFTMLFSSSMSVVEYYLLGRFPVPFALYLIIVSLIGGASGQYIIQTLVKFLGRTSIIIILLTSLTFFSAAVLGGIGIEEAVQEYSLGEYMGFSALCN